jgi:8-oxo-dGTP pyrophosphatase MutT (NUDIX family)
MTISDLKAAFKQKLPGIKGHQLLMPSYRHSLHLDAVASKNPKRAGVLVHLFEGVDGIEVLLMKRPVYDGTHSGQISFPGGKFEDDDHTLENTAYREAFEEVGLRKEELLPLGALSWLYIPPSNFYVEPYVTYSPTLPELVLEEKEVAYTLSIALSRICDRSILRDAEVMTKYGALKVPAFHWKGEVIWGATAMILGELSALFS